MAKSKARVVLWHLLMAGAGAGALATWRWQRRWGATAAEQRAVLPGDDLVPQPGYQATRAIGIDAPPDVVWPWLVQLGQDKGGFYSYDWLENLAGLNIHSADSVHPEWQRLTVGDKVVLAEPACLRVAVLEDRKALVLHGEDSQAAPVDMDFSWAFVLEPEGPAGTRLVVRERYAWAKWAVGVTVKAVAWVSFVMSRAMLVGIKRRAEGVWLADLAGCEPGLVHEDTDQFDDAAGQPPAAAGPDAALVAAAEDAD
ncbi:MAG: hypothetical protein LBK95_12830 [Bifidobacteriaceae bacterium]|jgi:hypothetical protein|nr:hypothetical protein [Bifidobacteriaceae bacterium]